ncbi:MAG: hypothetical protein HC824_16650 [Synechococcales cyanobacterium RM1_1_8]|nr:hypothetical protein [Synechococcales cyanobacterium RM1_1_8]
MAGFLGLFGGKKEEKETFFLDSDESKSLGDIEYMRTPSVVRRTFAKKAGETEHKEYVQKITAMGREVASESAPEFQPKQRQKLERQLVNEKSYPTFGGGSVKSAGSVKPDELKAEAEKVKQAPVKSVSDPSGMDMFRKMAKDLNKH